MEGQRKKAIGRLNFFLDGIGIANALLVGAPLSLSL